MRQLSDVELIFAVVAALYLVEMVLWVRGGAAAVASRLSRFGIARGRSILANDSGAVRFSGPAPWDAAIFAQPLPFSCGSAGLAGFVTAAAGQNARPPQGDRFIPWGEVDRIERDNAAWLYLGEPFCRFATPSAAKHELAAFQAFAREVAEARPGDVEGHLASMFDAAAASERVAAWRRATRILRVAGTLLFVWVFGVGVALYALWPPPRYDETAVLLAYLAAGLLQWWLCVLLVYLAHRRLYPAQRASRWKSVFTTLVSPAAAMRGGDMLARRLFDCVHPLAILAATADAQAVRHHAGEAWRDARHPLLPEEPPAESGPDAAEVVAEHHGRHVALLRRLIEQLGLNAEELERLPEPSEAEVGSVCGRCLQEFSEPAALCDACGGRAAVAASPYPFLPPLAPASGERGRG